MAHCECDDASIGLHDPSGCELVGMRVATAYGEAGTIVRMIGFFATVRLDRGPLYLSEPRDLTFRTERRITLSPLRRHTMHTMLVIIAIKLATSHVQTAPAKCGAPRDIGGGQTVRTCEVVK